MGKRGPKPMTAAQLKARGSWLARSREREEAGLPGRPAKARRTRADDDAEAVALGALPGDVVLRGEPAIAWIVSNGASWACLGWIVAGSVCRCSGEPQAWGRLKSFGHAPVLVLRDGVPVIPTGRLTP